MTPIGPLPTSFPIDSMCVGWCGRALEKTWELGMEGGGLRPDSFRSSNLDTGSQDRVSYRSRGPCQVFPSSCRALPTRVRTEVRPGSRERRFSPAPLGTLPAN